MRWKNGGGTSREIAAAPASVDPAWRLSIATIDCDGPFSDFTGYDRSIVPVEGHGVELTFDEVDVALVDRRFQPYAFRGERRTWCRLLDGPVRYFNVMTRRSAFSHAVAVREAGAPIAVERGSRCFVHVLSGGIGEARAGDTLRIDRPGAFATDDAELGTLLCVATIAAVSSPPSKPRRKSS